MPTQGMEETYATMSETVLQGLRRRLPVAQRAKTVTGCPSPPAPPHWRATVGG